LFRTLESFTEKEVRKLSVPTDQGVVADKEECAAKFVAECHSLKDGHFDNTLIVPATLIEKYKEELKESAIKTLWERYNHYKFFLYQLLEESRPSAEGEIRRHLEDRGLPFLRKYVSKWKDMRTVEERVFYCRFAQLPTAQVYRNWYRSDDKCGEWCGRRKSYMLDKQKEALKNWPKSLEEVWDRIGDKYIVDVEDDWIRSTIFRHLTTSMSDRVNALRYEVKHSEFPIEILTGSDLIERFKLVVADVKHCMECLGRTHITSRKHEALVVGERDEEERREEMHYLRETEIPAGFIANASVSLLRVLHASGFDQTAVIAEFLAQVKSAFPCEVCDYLSVENGGNCIEWRAATIEKKHMSEELQALSPDEQRKRINLHEAYDRGVGISGSILLQDFTDRTLWFHIGSSNVQEDPRGSEQHKSAYESGLYVGVLNATKKIENFWMFPVFDRFGRLTGAFRVVNRLDETALEDQPRLRAGGWAYLEKVQLSLVAAWFSRFLAAIQERGRFREDFLKILRMETELSQLLVNLGNEGLNWVSKKEAKVEEGKEDSGDTEADEEILDMMLRLLRILTNLTARKMESRKMGCAVFIDSETASNPPLKGIPEYPLVEVSGQKPSAYEWEALPELTAHEDLEWLLTYCDAIDPMHGAFVFDHDGGFSRVVLYSSKSQSGEEAAKSVTKKHRQSVCFLLERGMKSVLILARGERQAEIRLAERSGEWRFRTPGSLLESLNSNYAGEIADGVLKAVADTAMVLSRRGEGGILVVGPYPKDQLRLGNPQLEPPAATAVTNVTPHLLADCARLDGATFISKDGFLRAYNRNVRFSEDPGLKPLFPGRGARHETAERIARCAQEALVTVVSQNGEISVIKMGGKEISGVL